MEKKTLAQMIDHTLLKPAKKAQIEKLCQEARDYGFASVCIHPYHVKVAAAALEGSNVKVCTVVGFPLGENTTQTKVFETKNAIKNGATEIDMVMNQSLAMANQWKKIEKEITAVVKAAKGLTVKVILETCELNSKQIEKACIACANAGANFVKTSTGFSKGGATAADVQLMYNTVKERGLQVKASGGVRTFDDAMRMIDAGATRIGTSNSIVIMEGCK